MPFVIIGVIVLALIVGVVALVALSGGDDDEPEEAAPSSTTSTTEAFPADNEEVRTLNRVPAAFRDTCERDEELSDETGVNAAVTCTPEDGADVATYTRYASREEMNEVYTSDYEDNDVSADTGNCEEEFGAEYVYDVGDNAEVGRVACYLDGDEAVITWTHDRFQIISTGRRPAEPSGEGALYDWWSTEAGPAE